MIDRKRTMAILAITLGGGVLAAGCSAPAAKGSSGLPPVAVSIEKVQTSPLTIGDTFLGTVTPYIQTQLALGTNGTLASIHVHAGDVVHAGELLASLDSSYTSQQTSAENEAQASLAGAQQQYADALAMYNDRTSAQQQLTSAQGAATDQKSAIEMAQVNLQKAQLQEQATLNGGSQQDVQALQSVVSANEQAVTSSQQQLQEAQDNMTILQQSLTTAQVQDGNITTDQVQKAYQNYMNALSSYNSWQNGAFVGENPYAATLQATQTIYQTLNTGYNALQQAQQLFNQGTSTLAQAKSNLAGAQATLQNSQKNLADSTPDGSSNAGQQAHLAVTAAQTSLTQAEEQYKTAEANLQIAKTVYNDRTQAKQAVDNAMNALRQSMANVNSTSESLQVQIKNGQVISPIDGYVQAVNGQVGENVGPQTPIITIASTEPEIATVKVPELDINKVKVGGKVSVYLPDGDATLNGTVQAVHPQLDSTTNEYPVDIQLDDPHQVARIGLLAEARLQTTTSQTTIVVPADSVLTMQSGAQEVFVIRNGVAHPQIVQVGAMSGSLYQITSGLNLGDQLVVQGQNLLSDGDAVHIVSTTGLLVPGN